MQNNTTVLAQAQGDTHVPIDRRRQDKALVVVGVFAHDIDASGRDRNRTGGIAKRLPEQGASPFIELMGRAHAGWGIR